MKSALFLLLLAIAFLAGGSTRALTIDAPETVTEYVILPPAQIAYTPTRVPQEHAPEPPAPEVAAEATPEPQPTPLSVQPQRYYTFEQFMEVVAETPFPVSEWSTLWEMSSGCEATGTADDGTPRIDAQAVGDHGLAHGAFQIRIDAHPALARTFDLFDLRESLVAAFIIWERDGYRPWSCAP